MGFFTKFFGRTASEGAAFALGVAVGPALSPAVRELVNAAWSKYPTMPLRVTEMAMGVAQGQVDRGFAASEALKNGIDAQRFNALVRVFDTGPGIEPAYALWRRGLIDEAGFRRAAKRAALEPEWIDALVAAKQVLLTPAELANARQQGFIDVPRQHEESAKQGIDPERADLLFEMSGLPPGTARALEMARRGIIDRGTFGEIVREGHEKTKYTDEEWALLWNVVGATTYAELHLRGWISEAEMNAGGALTGYRPEDMQRLFHARGRPATTHQAFIGVRRGGEYDGPLTGIPPWFINAVRQSNLRNEWINILWAQRFTYPSAFVLRGLTQSGDLTQAEAHEILLKVGWEPNLAQTVSQRWAGGAGAATDPHIGKAETQLWTTLHSSFLNRESTTTQARATLTTLGIPPAARDTIINLWNVERDLIRKQLTPAQIKKSYLKASRNAATGNPWTRDEAIAALVAEGYSVQTANDFLDSGTPEATP